MTFKTTLIAAALFAALAAGGTAFAQEAGTDFGTLSNEELTQLRGQTRNMSEEDRIRFQNEMQSRAQNMTPEERDQAGLGPANAAGRQGEAGKGHQVQKRDGSGDQDRSMQRKRDGSGSGQGGQQGGQQNRPRDGSGYGDGYQSRQGQGGRGGRR